LDAKPELSFFCLLSMERERLYLFGPISVLQRILKRFTLSRAQTLSNEFVPFLSYYFKLFMTYSVLARLWFNNMVFGAAIDGWFLGG